MQWQAHAYVNDFLDGTLKAVTAQRSLLIKSTFQFQRGIQMSKLFAAVFAATFALGSLSELSVALRLAKDLELMSEDAWRTIERLRNHAGTLVWRLYAAVGKNKRQVGSPPTARYRPIPPNPA